MINMNPLIILSVIGIVVGGIWAGISSLLYGSSDSANVPFMSFIPKFPIDFSQLTNHQVPINITDNQTSYDWQKFINDNPLQTILSNLGNISSSVINYVSSPMQWLVTFLVHLFAPNAVLPSYFGMILTLLIFLVFLYFTYETILHIVGRIAVIALIIVAMIISIVIVLSVLGVLH